MEEDRAGVRTILSILLDHLRTLCTIPDFDSFVASMKQNQQVQAVLSLIRGVCSLENPNIVCISFYTEILPFLTILFQRTRAYEEIRMSILHILNEEASILSSMPEESNLQFVQTLLTIITESIRALPGDEIQIKKASDRIVKTLSLLFKILCNASTNTILTDSCVWDTSLMAGYLKLLSAVSSQLTFFPLLMKTIFDTSLMLCGTCIQGMDTQSPNDIEGFFSFMVTSLDRYEYDWNERLMDSCEFKSMDCLYLLFTHCLEIRDGKRPYGGSWNEGILGYLSIHPSHGVKWTQL